VGYALVVEAAHRHDEPARTPQGVRRRLRDAECPFGACSTESFEDLHGELAGDVPFSSIYSRRDGIVQWRACLDPHARHVEVRCSHLAMAVDRAVSSEVLRSLAQTPTEPPA
jgi:triacylglycerol lipase